MTFFLLFCLLTFTLSFSFGLFCFVKNPRNPPNVTFFVNSLANSLWSLGLGLMTVASTQQMANFWITVHYLGASFIPATFALYIYTFLKATQEKKLSLAVWWIIGSAFFIFTLVKREFFITASTTKPFFGYYTDGGLLYPIYTVAFFICVGEACFSLIRTLRGGPGLTGKHVQYVLMASLVGFGGGSTAFFPVFDLNIYPFGMSFVFLYPIIMTYAIVRHQLMDIEVVIKKTVVFAGLAGSVVGVVSLMAFVSQDILARYVAIPRLWSNVLAAMIIAALYGRIQTWLVNVTDRFLFQRRYDYRGVLRRFTDEVLVVLDLRRLVDLTIQTLMKTVRVESCALLLLNRVTNRYELTGTGGLLERHLSLESTHPAVQFLQKAQEPLMKEVLQRSQSEMEELMEVFTRLKAEIMLPLVLHKELIGIMGLGHKKSDEPYTKEDLDILMTVANTEAIAISNALLAAEVAQKEKLAVIGTLAAAINHEVCNPLNNVRVQAEGFLIDMDQGSLAHLSQEDRGKLKEFMNLTVEEIDRAAAITTRLSNFAKPVREPTSEPVDVQKAVDEVWGILGHDLRLRGVVLENGISPGLPPIFVDRKQLYEILFNLIRNAGEAIEQNGTVTIRAERNGVERVAMQVADTGFGIPPEQLPRLFTPFFTTKKEGRGTGLGLFVVKQLVERNGGTIRVESQQGVGTTFAIEFPVAKVS